MAMTPAEKQRAYRQRERERIAKLEQAAGGNVTAAPSPGNVTERASPGNVTDEARAELQAEVERLRARVAELEAECNVTPEQEAAIEAEVKRIQAEILKEVDKWPRVQQARWGTLADKINWLLVEHWRHYLANEHEEVGKERARLREATEKGRAEWHKHMDARKGVAGQITKDDYRRLLGVLHPDREPSPEQRAAAFDIVKKLQPYIDAVYG